MGKKVSNPPPPDGVVKPKLPPNPPKIVNTVTVTPMEADITFMVHVERSNNEDVKVVRNKVRPNR